MPADALIARLADSSDPSSALTLIVHRFYPAAAPPAAAAQAGEVRPVAIASYFAASVRAAEVAFAVADDFQGKGLATMLLERLAVLASQSGFEKFQASTLADNLPMLEVFRDSGFEIRSKTSAGVVDLQLALTPSAEGVRLAEVRDRLATARSLEPMLTPHAVAVIGASRETSSIGRRVLDALRSGGFAGPIYPVNPKVVAIDGLTCYPSARALPSGVDLAVIAVPTHSVLEV